MKNLIPILFIFLILSGCGKSGKSEKVSELRMAELHTQIQMLQQTIEIQGKQVKALELKVAALKAENFKASNSDEALRELEVRVSDLEGSGYLK